MIKTYPHNIFKILAAIILLGVIAAGYISWQRYNVEAHATTVEMVYDYNNILESASVESTSADELFSLYKRSGITSLAVYDEAIEINPNFAKAYHERGRIKLLKGDKDGSVEDMKKAIELAPENEMNISGQYNNYENMTKNVPF